MLLVKDAERSLSTAEPIFTRNREREEMPHFQNWRNSEAAAITKQITKLQEKMSNVLPLRQPKNERHACPDSILKTKHGMQPEHCRQERRAFSN